MLKTMCGVGEPSRRQGRRGGKRKKSESNYQPIALASVVDSSVCPSRLLRHACVFVDKEFVEARVATVGPRQFGALRRSINTREPGGRCAGRRARGRVGGVGIGNGDRGDEGPEETKSCQAVVASRDSAPERVTVGHERTIQNDPGVNFPGECNGSQFLQAFAQAAGGTDHRAAIVNLVKSNPIFCTNRACPAAFHFFAVAASTSCGGQSVFSGVTGADLLAFDPMFAAVCVLGNDNQPCVSTEGEFMGAALDGSQPSVHPSNCYEAEGEALNSLDATTVDQLPFGLSAWVPGAVKAYLAATENTVTTSTTGVSSATATAVAAPAKVNTTSDFYNDLWNLGVLVGCLAASKSTDWKWHRLIE
ncbi:hypothetical protein BDK51DRAFT_39830 [Blyttiomyces helicus]|uniref:Uncharacterized protein n=1 Tax=Blyttiomyces helicus TaxID=388810 RepID=A0A4P9W472_9FUNG|nr:hypothetical protein BDK51DRAFT_39830 [Blyttiomyces helicus]|eukprot:RKO84966.1 hypothetical protein BDK51DRAFT_39830 [Blyttiomyces helicus]